MNEELAVVGIDISKRKFDAVLLLGTKARHKVCSNDAKGYAELQDWLKRQGVEQVHVCMESTGNYWEPVATALAEAGHVVSVVNPAAPKAFADSELTRTKTDKADAGVIARFCKAHRPAGWTPPGPELRELRELYRRLKDLQEMEQMEKNRLESGVSSKAVEKDIQELLASLKERIEKTLRLIEEHIGRYPDLRQKRNLLMSIQGVGEATANLLLAELGDLTRFGSAKELAAHCGLVPHERSSGSSIRGARLSKRGNARVRAGLYMPAIVAKQYNRVLKAFYERLLAKGKTKMQAICAVMRKLLHLAYGVLKSGRPFDPDYTQQKIA